MIYDKYSNFTMDHYFIPKWDFMYDLCVEYKNKYGDLEIPKRYKYLKDGKYYNLGSWLCSQREMYHCKGNRKYIQEHVDKLTELGIVWEYTFNRNNISFPEMAIRYYLDKHFNTTKYNDGFEIDIYIPKLNIGIEYDGKAWHNKKSDIHKNNLCKNKGIKLYRIRENGCDKLDGYSIDFYYDRNNINELNNVIKLLLNNFDIKDEVDVNKDATKIYDIQKNSLTQPWKDKYYICKKYYDEHGNIDFPYSMEIDGVKIGCWLNEQSKKYKKGKLEPEKIKLLEDLGMQWYKKLGRKNVL